MVTRTLWCLTQALLCDADATVLKPLLSHSSSLGADVHKTMVRGCEHQQFARTHTLHTPTHNHHHHHHPRKRTNATPHLHHHDDHTHDNHCRAHIATTWSQLHLKLINEMKRLDEPMQPLRAAQLYEDIHDCMVPKNFDFEAVANNLNEARDSAC